MRRLYMLTCIEYYGVIEGAGGEYWYIRVLLKTVVFKFILEEITGAEHEYINIHHLPTP